MSGWFGTSNRETNNPLDGIKAGHRRRRNHQKQRYKSMGRMTIDQMAQQNPPMTPTGDIQQYRGFKLESTFNAFLNKWVTKGSKGLNFFNAAGRSKGESVNAVKSKIDNSLGIVEPQMTIFTDASSASTTDATVPVTDPGEVARFNRLKAQEEARKMFTPVTLPIDFTTGRYTVRAAYNSMSRKYTVSVFEGTVVKEVATFNQDQGPAAVAKHAQFKSLATKKTVYEGKKPLSVAKTNYDVKLQVTTAAAGLSGFFNGIMNIFGLGLTVDQMVEQSKVGPKPDFHAASSASVTTDYTSASNRPEVSAKWSEMPAKSFKVITSRKDGTVVKESGSTSDYLKAVDMFQAEVATIENTPDFYDQDAPLVPEVPTNNGNGGDITSSPDKRPSEPTVLSSGVVQFPAGRRFQFINTSMIETTQEVDYRGYVLRGLYYGYKNKSHSAIVIEVRTKNLPSHKAAFQTFFADLEKGVKVNAAADAARAWVDANPLVQNDGPGNTGYRDPIMIAADEKKRKDAANAKLAEAARFERRKEQEARKAAQAKAAAAKARADREAAQDYLRQESARAEEEKAAADARAAEQKASEAAAAEAQAKADALKFLQQDASVVTTDTTTVYQDPIITQAQTGSENYNELVNAGEDTTTFYQDPIITQAQNRPAYVTQNYENNPYIVQQATADNATFKQPGMTSNQTMGLALVGLAGLVYASNRK